ATHIECPYRRSSLKIQTDCGGPAQTALLGIGVCSVPANSPGILLGRITASGGLLPFTLRGQADFIPQVAAQPVAEGDSIVPGDVLSRVIILLAILLARLRPTLCQPAPPALLAVAILRFEKTAVLRPGDGIFADSKRPHGERPSILFEG